MGAVSRFLDEYFLHFNARETVAAARGWKDLLAGGGKMFLTMAGAMSTGELGKMLARMIRADKVHAISCTAANLEEDIFNLVAHDHYRVVPNYRELSAADEVALYDQGLNRVTDTCIPEDKAFQRIRAVLLPLLQESERLGRRMFPYEYFYTMIREGLLKQHYQIPPEHSWVAAACEKNLPIFSPGYEDSTLGNVVAAWKMTGKLKDYGAIKTGLDQMEMLAGWYLRHSRQGPIGFFQIGGGIAGDFAICVVPMIHQDMKEECPYWSYFAQISDSTTSYGSYSGAVPNEKITWGKLDVSTPKFMINSDAAIVAPLIFAHVLDD